LVTTQAKNKEKGFTTWSFTLVKASLVLLVE